MITQLHKHLAYTMKQHSAGVLLYRKGGDLLLALTKVLCRERRQTSKSTQEPNTSYDHGQCILENGSEAVWEEMNHTQHAQIRLTLGKYSKPYDITSLDMGESGLKGIDKKIIKMIATLIKPQRDENKSISEVYEEVMCTQRKKLWCFYIASLLMFCTNSQCNMPFHVLLTDVIESYGGSSELIKLFNRLRVVASRDTHALTVC